MSRYYRHYGCSIGPHPAVSLDNNDKMLSGAKGWIYVANEEATRLGVVTINDAGYEVCEYCDIKDLQRHLNRIKWFSGPDGRSNAELYANCPNWRHKRVQQ